MRFADFSARSPFAEPLPRTKQSASPTLLFPEPLGPKIQLYLGSKTSSVFSPKDLNPRITSRLMRVIITTFFACTMKKYRKNELFAVYKTFESMAMRKPSDEDFLKNNW